MSPHSEDVDDFALRVSAASAASLLTGFTAASAAALTAHELVGLPVNVAPDKTGALMLLGGKGA
eukprot:10469393-Prorocentrum_lima.AAC.1